MNKSSSKFLEEIEREYVSSIEDTVAGSACCFPLSIRTKHPLFFLFQTYRALFFSTRAIGKAITPDVDHKSNWQSIPRKLLSLLFFSLYLSFAQIETHTVSFFLRNDRFCFFWCLSYKIRNRVYLYFQASVTVSHTSKIEFTFKEIPREAKFSIICK